MKHIFSSRLTLTICSCLLLLATQAWAQGGVCVIGGMTRESKLQLGGKTEGKIMLRNVGKEAREVKMYQTDYSFAADGTTVYGEPGSMARSNAAWITYSPHQLTIQPGETALVYFSVQVPSNNKLIGSYWSVLMAEQLPQGALDLQRNKPETVSIGVRTVMRYAIQIVTHIGDTGKYAVKFANRQIQVKEHQRLLWVDVENIGEHGMRPTLWTEIYDENGVSLGRFDGNRLRIYPGCSARFEVDLSQLPAGKFKALLVADNGDDNVFGTQCQFELK